VFDTARIEYMRKHQAVQNALSFYTQSYQAAILDGFTSANIRLFDISDDGSPLLMSNLNPVFNGSSFSVKVPAAPKGRVFFAVEDSGLLTPASLTANTPSTLTTTNHNADLLIITYKTWATEAQNWATYRNGQGTTVEVVDVDDIYDEYNYGVLSSGSVKNFLHYAKDNWQTPPRYVLLLGDASFDPRDYWALGFSDFIPVKIVTTIFSETGSDDWLADFNDDGLAELAVGRISAKTPAEVTAALTKVSTFEQPTHQSLGRGALFASDVDANYDFGAMSGRIRDQLPVGTPTTMISRGDANAQANLISAMNTGNYIVNYSGHGALGVWANQSFFGYANVTCSPGPTCISFAGNESIYTMLTCLNGYFFDPRSDSLAERLDKAGNGGAVASWASTGLTTPDVQEVMATRFYNQIGMGNMQRLGDLVLDAKSVVSGGSDVRLSWTLLGDPMLKVHPDPAVKMRAESLAPLQK
jgi:hypothetical protein